MTVITGKFELLITIVMGPLYRQRGLIRVSDKINILIRKISRLQWPNYCPSLRIHDICFHS